jgi:hypothetical protein
MIRQAGWSEGIGVPDISRSARLTWSQFRLEPGHHAGTCRTNQSAEISLIDRQAEIRGLHFYRLPRVESAVLATVVGGRSRIRSGFGAADLRSGAGNRPATVQHVEGERNEQSGSRRGAAGDEWAVAAHP